MWRHCEEVFYAFIISWIVWSVCGIKWGLELLLVIFFFLTSMSLSCGRRPARSAGEPGSRERMYWPGLDFSLCRLKPYPVSARTRWHSLGTSSDTSSGVVGTAGASWDRDTADPIKLWFEEYSRYQWVTEGYFPRILKKKKCNSKQWWRKWLDLFVVRFILRSLNNCWWRVIGVSVV